MCTVSFVNANGRIIITSNRDEQVLRPAIPPGSYLINNYKLVFPKDPKAGGTWYAVDDNANVLVLLNGAAEKHKHLPPYSRSRGLIVLDILGSDSATESWDNISLDNVEPFTLVLFYHQELYQLRWNGVEKSKVSLDKNKNHIWSSSTLYPKEIRETRAEWFYKFLDTKPGITAAEMLHFHRYTETDNSENGLVINRDDKLKTLSITQAVIEGSTLALTYADLINENQSANSFLI
jgi:transport and Golgi organization protein 2